MGSQHVPAPMLSDLLTSLDLAASSRSAARPSTDPIETFPPPRVAIVGGSLGGCCAAIALRSVGCEVEVFERNRGVLRSQGAGLVIQEDMAAFLTNFQVCDVKQIAVPSAGRQYVDKTGKVIDGDDQPQLFSAWDAVYATLRQKVPDTFYHAGRVVESVAVEGDKVQIAIGGEEERLEFDMVIGADGPGSLVRSTFCPQARSVYQGYIAWRGLLEEQHTPSHILSFLGSRFTVYSGPDFHILAYLIPGSKGEVEKGCRRVNWVWYWNTKPDNLDDILTDVHGHRHGFSLPRGLLRPEVAEVTRKLANEVLPSVLADMVGATPDIFVQAIHDMLSPHLAFHGRVALLGDAGCILRPHTAAGTTKAAVNAWALASCLEACGFDVQRALEEYEAAMLPLAKRLVEVGVAIGTRSQFPQKVARAGETNDSGIALE